MRFATLGTVSYELAVAADVQSLIGLNTNLTLGDQVLHVQTEDMGRQRACIVTHVFSKDGRVVDKVRFDYSRHLGHPKLLGIIPRAMRAQHTAVMQRLRKEGVHADNIISSSDLPCITEPSPTPCPEAPKTNPKQRPRMDPGTWDRLVAKAKAERERERRATLPVPLPEANSQPIALVPRSNTEEPRLPQSHPWDAAVASARREFDRTPALDATPAKTGVTEARRNYERAKLRQEQGDLEGALVLSCRAVALDVRNQTYREQLSALLDQLGRD